MKGSLLALLAAVLFGASTPAAKLLLNEISPWWLSAILYLGSGLGVSLILIIRKLISAKKPSVLFQNRADWKWLAGATFFGGILGPTFLMYGLSINDASSTSLLLNMEGVLTSLVAWFVLKEHFNRRTLLGTFAIICGATLLSWPQEVGTTSLQGSLLILAACLSWAIDNNLTRKISANDPFEITAVKSIVSGCTNALIASFVIVAPTSTQFLFGGIVGFFGYGMSLICFVLALRYLGTARTGAYFSTAPFVGAVISYFIFKESLSMATAIAGALMALGVWLHFTELHSHEHEHEELSHSHKHVHDVHHQHDHSTTDPSGESHTHFHTHIRMKHSHPHFPDIHHRHEH